MVLIGGTLTTSRHRTREGPRPQTSNPTASGFRCEQWQPARHKENGITVDDGIRPFSVELELDNGDKVFCVVRSS
jgi:hypothetical protein